MTNWKELGEVPDSEEEDSFDSQITASQGKLVSEAHDGLRDDLAGDVWDVPPSQDDLTRAPTRTPATAKTPTVTPWAQRSGIQDPWDVPLSDGEDELAGDHHAVSAMSADAPPPNDALDPTSSPLSTLSSISFEDMPGLPLIDLTFERGAPDSSREGSNQPSIDITRQSAVSTPVRLLDTNTPAVSSELGERESEYVARQAAVRYERSLRARKPIQQHPFLIEMAQYRTSMQSRGLKPLRIAAMESEGRRRNGEAQEREYEPESQDSNGGDGSGQAPQTSSQDFGDMDDWAFPSSSPPSPPRATRIMGPSSQTSSREETDNTSVQFEDAAPDELPSLEDLLLHRPRPKTKHTPKRKSTSPRTGSSKRYRRLVLDSDDITAPTGRENSLDPVQTRPVFWAPSSPIEPIPDFSKAQPKSLSNQEARPVTSALVPAAMVIDSGSESDSHTVRAPEAGTVHRSDSAESSSEGGEQIVNTVGRRIRGVLPASWLRLDQQSGRDSIRKTVVNRAMNKSPEREHRRGVAQKRRAISSTSFENPRIWSDESEDDAPAPGAGTTDDAFPNQTTLAVERSMIAPRTTESLSSDDEDASGRLMEDNQIDRMLAPRKRQLKLSESFQNTPKRQKNPQSAAKSRTNKAKRQQKITNALAGTSVSTAPRSQKRAKRVVEGADSRKTSGSRKLSSRRNASHLSILDVIEPDAPRFLKIAARTAKQRPNQGRGSPGRKTIKLANREDHVDASTVLQQWRRGSIPQRSSVTSSMRKRRDPARAGPLKELTPSTTNRSISQQDTRSTEHVGERPRPAVTIRKNTPFQSHNNRDAPRTDPRTAFRPAQLETSGADPVNSRTFYTGKRALDRLFKKPRAAASTVDMPIFDDVPDLEGDEQPQSTATSAAAPQHRMEPGPQKSRYRKQRQPVQEDLGAPQYVHAHDPLPRQPHEDAGPTVPHEPELGGARMSGLGSFGTKYTRHFEIFPLPVGVYFHESSLIGSGMIASVANHSAATLYDESRSRVSYSFGDQVLRWGPWSAQISSELGLLFDSIAEKLDQPPAADGSGVVFVTKAADFVLSYVKGHVSFEQASDVKLFLTRFGEVVRGFNDKVNAKVGTTDMSSESRCSAFQRVYERLLVAVLCVLQICRKDSALFNDQFQAEELLQAVAKTCICLLSRRGTASLREAYRALDSPRMRERGLREDATTMHTWVTVTKTLDEARILRGSFWDLVQAHLSMSDYIKSHNAEQHDVLWQDLFTFLPLVEFNNMGILRPGDRHESVHDGWALPQKLLKIVFQLYRENPRQPPSFNDYCRALVGRCHYLVEHWGWKRSASVIGVIFDFFGSQNLAHLRNEEVYKSPRFLDMLANDPSLEISAEDCCFHIFLKLLALTIRQLRAIGADKDIRNLVARTIPNHNRQYLKDQDVHQRDLAALRNHHDLLCTLFWACPPDQRPNPVLIQGLVDPASSHKETCLINLRAWSQLARYLVSSGEASTRKVFGPFVSWRDDFFGKMLNQYSSIGSEIHQQFHSLAKEEREGVSNDMLNAMISANKIAVQDVLHFSVTSSYDVMRQCPDLEAAVWSLSTKQLQQVFDHFAVAPPDLDWSLLTTALRTLDVFLAKIDDFKDAEDSQQRESQLLDSEQADDALQTLDAFVAKKYFSMARCVLSGRGEERKLSAVNAMDRAACMELIVTLSSRFAARLVASGAMRLGQLFKYGNYGLFDAAPHKLHLDQRRYLTLCILSLLKAHVDDFDDAGFTLMDVWMLAIVKPRRGLSWENQLGEELQRIGQEFVPEAAVALAVQAEYHTNRDLFEFAITHMRTSTRKTEPSLKKTLISSYGQTLKHVMEQMTSDLKAISNEPSEHPAYVSFVREVISLIRSHGSEMCPIDDFFYQISKDYSPPAEDPQLQVAGMVSYELKINDPGAQQQLFFFMFNNFKVAMSKDKLGEESFRLWTGMKSAAIRRFVLGKMLPAAFRAAWQQREALVLVNTYMDGLELLLAGHIMSTELTKDDLEPVLCTISAIATGFQTITAMPLEEEVHLVNRALSFMNMIWPSLLMMHISSPGLQGLKALRDALGKFRHHFEVIARHLELPDGFPYWETGALVRSALHQVAGVHDLEDAHVKTFTYNIVNDIRRNWTRADGRIGIKTPAKGRSTQTGTQTGQGALITQGDAHTTYEVMRTLLADWHGWWKDVFAEDEAEGPSLERIVNSEALLF